MSLFPAGIFAPVRQFFHRDPARMPDLTGRRALLSGLPLLLMRRAAPDPPPAPIRARIYLHGWNVMLRAVPPGEVPPTPGPGRDSQLLEMERGWRLSWITDGPDADFRERMERAYARRPDAIGPLDWAEMELEVFGEKGGAR